MRSFISILVLEIVACSCFVLGQSAASSGADSRDTYRDRLKAEASDSARNTPSADDGQAQASRDSYRDRLRTESSDSAANSGSSENSAARYRDRLRQLAGGNEAQVTQHDSVPKPEPYQNQSADQRNSSVAGDESPSDHPSGIVPVEQRTLSSAPVQSKDRTSEQSRYAATCSDSYCKQLRRVSEGGSVEPNIREFEPPRTLTTEKNFVKNLAFDQLHIWTSPFRLREGDATWAIPFGIVTGSLIASDRWVSGELVNPGRIDTSKQISNLGLYTFIGAGAGVYGLGLISHNDHQRETGLLSGEAFINATLVAEALKTIVGRERPFEGDHFGHIGRGGSSFPSGHAIDSWAVATVFAHEYPNPFVQIASYGLASAVSVARITAQQHYASDVLVGSAFGYLIGRKIYRDHHNPELPGADYGTFVRERGRDASHSGTAYVPLESWVYPAIDRLAGLGYIHSNFNSERPFSRLECARLTAEASENADSAETPSYVLALIGSLQQEFGRESEVWAGGSDNRSAELESVYTRLMGISGPPLRDGYHFAQTLYNDYGRPYGSGFNNITGFSTRATAGPLVFYFRGEYQHAPGQAAYPQSVVSLTSQLELNPPNERTLAAADHFEILDAYVGLAFGGQQFSLGPQTLSWGPGTSPFMLSDNARPINMVRLNRIIPEALPGFLRYLGPLRFDVFMGQLSGHDYINLGTQLVGPGLKTQPFIQGQRFSFKPTENFEFGFTRTGIFGGDGHPLTWSNFLRATFSNGSSGSANAGLPHDPGDRRSGFDMSYRIPGARDWLSFYLDSFTDDETTPVLFPRRSVFQPGLYVAKIPGLARMDLRLEGVYTDGPGFGVREGSGFFYFNSSYRDGYTNDGNLLGNWIGRNGRGGYAASRIWLSGKNSIQFAYRHGEVDKSFLEGGRYNDGTVTFEMHLPHDLSISALAQYENWRFPALAAGAQNAFVTSFQFSYSPSWAQFKKKDSE